MSTRWSLSIQTRNKLQFTTHKRSLHVFTVRLCLVQFCEFGLQELRVSHQAKRYKL